MRLLLVLLALLSGLSLSDVAVATSRAEVVGAAACSASTLAAQPHKVCSGLVKAEKLARQDGSALVGPLPQPVHVYDCTIRIPDRPLE